MPRSVFLGRTPAPDEPLWSDEDRAWALALHAVEADACPGCGHPSSETHDPAHEFAYEAQVRRCHSCAAAARAHRKFAKGNTRRGGDVRTGALDGITVTTQRRT